MQSRVPSALCESNRNNVNYNHDKEAGLAVGRYTRVKPLVTTTGKAFETHVNDHSSNSARPIP